MTNRIDILTDQFDDSAIVSANAFLVQSMAGSELEFDTFDATLDLSAYFPVVLSPSDADALRGWTDETETDHTGILTVHPWVRLLVHDPAAYAYGAAVLAYHDDALLGKFYMQSCKRVSRFAWQIEAVSPIGLLDKQLHYGGVYGSGATFSSVAASIIGGAIPYTINPALVNQQVRGWLPVATRRENLHQLLFAMGACVQKDDNGDVYITYLSPLSQTPTATLPDRRIYTGGSVAYPDKATEIVLYEHAFLASALTAEETLFDGQMTAESVVSPSGTTRTGAVVLFDEPIVPSSLTATGANIAESGANFAVLTFSGTTAVTLTGKPYAHTIRRVTVGEAADEDNVLTFEDATLVNVLNSEAVINRLWSFYGNANTVTMDIVVEGERAGDGLAFSDPFDDPAEGYIAQLGVSLSGIAKGAATVVTGYEPTTGNKFNNCAIMVSAGTWTVPAGVTDVRVVLIGKGQDGNDGEDGEDGERGSSGGYGAGGAGGFGGAGGNGGKIRTIDLTVAPGDTLTVSWSGDNSRVAYGGITYSSSSGQRSANGFTDLVHGHTFGLPGADGVDGGQGNPGGRDVSFDGDTWTPGDKGQDGSWEE